MKALYEDAPKLSDISEAFVQKYVEGIFDAGGDEDEQIFTLLPVAQKLADCEESIDSIEVSALTTPDKEPARKAATKGPGALSPADYETWYCTAYVSSICYQIQEAIPDSVASPVRQVAESEGAILDKTRRQAQP